MQLWVSLAIMIAESIISLIPIIYSYIHKVYIHHQQHSRTTLFRTSSHDNITNADYYEQDKLDADADDEDPEPPHRLVPISWVTIGLALSAGLCILLVWAIFGKEGIHPWATAVGLVLASILSLLGVRALGETDLNPVSGIGKISQLLFAVLQPGNVVANIIAGGVAEVSSASLFTMAGEADSRVVSWIKGRSSTVCCLLVSDWLDNADIVPIIRAGDLMQDLKTGALLKASPRSQFFGQMIGSLASVFVSVGAYKLYTRIYTVSQHMQGRRLAIQLQVDAQSRYPDTRA